MPDNMDMYLKHLSDWAQKEKVAGFRELPVEQPKPATGPEEPEQPSE
jgi:hypothetical protein